MIRDYTPVEKSEGDGFAVSCPVLRVADKEVRVCQDGDADLRVIYMGYERYRYEWLKVGETKVWSDSIVYPIRHACPVRKDSIIAGLSIRISMHIFIRIHCI